MSDIASYDLSRNVNLIELHLGSNNVAEKLDLSKNTKLETLAVCGNFDLTTLDVSNNPGLKHLNISDTDIWSIDVIDCPYIVKAIKNGEKGEGPSADGEHSFIFYEYGEDEVAMFFAFNEGATVKYEKEVPSPTSEPTKIPTQTPTATPTTKPSPTATKAPSGKVSISINKTSAMIKAGGKLQLKAVVKGTSNPVTWKSSNTYKPVVWAVEKGITTGTSKTKFSPFKVCTRAQTVTFLWRMAKKPTVQSVKNPFKDVKKSDYFYKAVLWASDKNIVAGYKDGTFKPQGKCLRRQMVTFLYKYDKYVNGKG